MSARSDLFERALAGEFAWNAEELERLRRESPQAARELDELLALQGELDARPEAAIDELPTAADRALVAATLDRLRGESLGAGPETAGAGEGEAPAPLRRNLFHLVRLAAAVLVVALLGWWWSSTLEDPEPVDVVMGQTADLEAVSPTGAVEDFAEFLAVGDLDAMEYCELQIWTADASQGSKPILERNLDRAAWTPSEAERASLPRHIRWQLTAFNRHGESYAKTPMTEAIRP